MNKTKKNFWLDVLLFIVFGTIISSSFVLDNHDPNLILWGLTRPTWVVVHAVSALAMLAGLAIHLGWHWDWIKAAFKRASRPKPTRVRRNRTVDLWLFGLLVLMCLSGLLIWPMAGKLAEGNPLGNAVTFGLACHDWKFLHAWSAVIMLIFMIVHLVLHWNWIVLTARRSVMHSSHPKAKKIVEAITINNHSF